MFMTRESVDGDTTPFINDEEDNRVHEILEDLRGVIGNSSKFVNEGLSATQKPKSIEQSKSGYPQAGNPEQWAPQGQNPTFQNTAQDMNADINVAAPAPSIVDLMRLCKEGKLKEAIELLDKGVKADADCFYALFELCLKLEDAKKVHDFCLQSSYRGDLKLNNKVIEMYGKCASMTDARRVFDHMPDRNMDSWHLMINGADAVEEGFLHLESMKNEYGINPRMEHYLGVIDVLGKSGFVNEIEEYIEKLPFESTVEIWGALRNYARIHGDVDLEDLAEELMVALDSSKAVANKIPTPLPKKHSAISMLEGKNRIESFGTLPFTKMMRN
ncbi:hypothetical protein GH714_035317 [Hevea brasiliensis]|uniref:Pentacotripeptide-repeat region of PRORP domain-containing protein n=1 Tax=Hevea brasiliensis TaxID=3981 RepID=A0A6A6N9D6_HEVBR|nr:hypothetical protein GH714_035317 [Hevea brasiliensis]